MKNVKLRLTAIALVALLVACTNKNSTDHQSNKIASHSDSTSPGSGSEGNSMPPNLTGISLAKTNVNSYRRSVAFNANALQGFNLNPDDLKGVLGISDPNNLLHARGYFGLDSNNNLKLYLVPVSLAGTGLGFSETNPGYDSLLVRHYDDQSDTLFLYELNYPCPAVCSTNNIFQ